MRGKLTAALLAVALVATIAAGLGIGVRALHGANVAVDEEQYLLTAISLAEDGSLDITDEMAEQRWRGFADVAPAVETSVLPDGQQISPHDPLLPLLLAVPAGLGGFVGAKVSMALLAGLAAALTLWLAVRRFGVRLRTATVGVGLAVASAPLAVYGQQLYPELPAAVAVLLAVVALTGRRRPAELALLAVTVAALPWLSVKYVPVGLTLAVAGAVLWWRAGRHRPVITAAVALTALGAGYLAVHRAVWGGWTVYASGDHFAQTGEFAVVGVNPDLTERTLRLAGLLLDREFGLVPWQPGWLLIVPAAAALAAWSWRGPAEDRVRDLILLVPLGVGWLMATFVALTMHGYWWPGRQLVVVLPLALLAVLMWADRCRPWVRVAAAALGLAGVAGYAVVLVQGYARLTTWVVHFVDADAPVYRLLHPVLADYRGPWQPGHLAGFLALAGLAVLAWRSAARSARVSADPVQPGDRRAVTGGPEPLELVVPARTEQFGDPDRDLAGRVPGERT